MSRSDQDATSAAELFDLLWESLADVPGTAATATLVRRAIKRRVAIQARHILLVEDDDNVRKALRRWPSTSRIDGYEVGRCIRAALGSRVLLVALTTCGQEPDRRRSSPAGFDAYLVKPVSHEDLTPLLGRAAGGDG